MIYSERSVRTANSAAPTEKIAELVPFTNGEAPTGGRDCKSSAGARDSTILSNAVAVGIVPDSAKAFSSRFGPLPSKGSPDLFRMLGFPFFSSPYDPRFIAKILGPVQLPDAFTVRRAPLFVNCSDSFLVPLVPSPGVRRLVECHNGGILP